VAVVKPEKERPECRQHDELSSFYAEVEAGECTGHAIGWKSDLCECASKSEAVDESECERDAIASRRVARPEVLQPDVCDRQCDQRFDEARAHADEAEH